MGAPGTVLTRTHDIAAEHFTADPSDGLGMGDESDGALLPPDPKFFSEWNTALGSTLAAIRDTDRTRPWPGTQGSPTSAFEVRETAADGRDYPTDNYLRMIGLEGSNNGSFLEIREEDSAPGNDDNYWSELADGETFAIRYYTRVYYPYESYDANTHGVEWQTANHRPCTYNQDYNATHWNWGVNPYNGGAPTGECMYGIGAPGDRPLVKGITYRLESLVTRVSSTQVSFFQRVYDVDDVLLYDSDDYFTFGGGSCPSTDPLSADNPFAAAATDWQHTDGWRLGLNGITGSVSAQDAGQIVQEWAAVAICKGANATWIGPYRAIEADF